MEYGCHSMVAPLQRVIVKDPDAAFESPERIAREWHGLGFAAPPDLARARREHAALVALLEAAGATVLRLPAAAGTTLDSLYAHDPALVTEAGVLVFATMGKPARRGEGAALADALRRWDVPILAVIEGEATAEGGDMVWLDRHTLLVGRGFRTNAAGVAAVARHVAPLGVRVIEVPLPYGGGPAECLHLMSLVSLVDVDLAVVQRRLLPIPLVELLGARGVTLVDVPDVVVATQGCNVLAVAPRRVVMVRGSPRTEARLREAGCEVMLFDGEEIALKGCGGPTCLTRPLWRSLLPAP